MKSISRVKIKNFQAIREADIKLGDITIISGKSDSGKSSFLRAMKAVVDNRTGDDYRTIGTKETRVSIDGCTWIQTKTINNYELEGVKDPFEKCGKDVPDKIAEYLNMGEIEFGKDIKASLNFYEQLTPAFIVQGNPATNAKIIGSVSDLHKVYNGIRTIEAGTKKTKTGLNQTQTDLRETAERLEQEEAEMLEMKGRVDAIRNLYYRAKEIAERLEQLEEACSRIRTTRTSQAAQQAIIKAVNLTGKEGRAIDRLQALGAAAGKCQQLQIQKAAQGCTIRALSSLDKDRWAPAIDRRFRMRLAIQAAQTVQGKIERHGRTRLALAEFNEHRASITIERRSAVTGALSTLETLGERISRGNAHIGGIKKNLKSLRDEIGTIAECETCGAPPAAWTKIKV